MQTVELNKALLAMYTNQAVQYCKIAAGLQSQSLEHLLPVNPSYHEKQHIKEIQLLQKFSGQYLESAAEIKVTMA